MTLIKDIRLFESGLPNVDGNEAPHYLGRIYRYDSLQCLPEIQRVLFLLRHRGFGFEEFDHLYLNLTPCIPHGQIRDVKRHNIREFSWFAYADVGCDAELFNSWSVKEQTAFILEAAKNASIMKAPEELRQLCGETFCEVLEKGENLLLPYKRKENPEYIAEIFLRIDDEPSFFPLIRVSGRDGAVKAELELRSYGRDEFIVQFGTITIGKTYVKIAPRKNFYAEYYDLKPIRITWEKEKP